MKEEFPDAVEMYIDSYMENVHTVLPGKIISYNDTERKAIVEPLIGLKTIKEVDITIPPIENVPVMFPSGSTFTLKWDIKKGDGCLIVFSEGSIGNFLNSSGDAQVAPEDSSKFDLTDAICIPGLFSFLKSKSISSPLSEINISNGNLQINSNKSIQLNGSNKFFVTHAELDTALQGFITTLNTTIGTKLDGGGTAGILSLDISTSKTTTIKTGG